MRLIKTFGLAVIAVAAVMAFVGASSAMATELEEVVLCKEDAVNAGDKCPAGKDFPSGTVLHGELASGTTAVLLSSLGTVECLTSTTLGTTTSLLTHGEITALSFSNCSVGAVGCTVTVEHLNFLAQVLLNDAHNGYHMVVTEGTHELESKKVPNGKPQAEVVCGTVIICKFGGSSILLTAELKTGDVVLSVLQELERLGGVTCPTTSTWHAKYLTRCLEGSSLVGCWPKMEPLL